jgi:uncharacterized protein YbjT (DUF2867 family)
MTAYVTGATGFVGREVVRQLAVRGTHVIAHVRPDSSSLETWRATFESQEADVDTAAWTSDAMGAALRELPAGDVELYVCIGTTRGKAKADNIGGNIYEAVDLGLTRIAVDAAKAAGRPIRIVYLSSVGADPKARSAYLRARGQAEEVVKASGLPWVIARPSIITGARDDARAGERAAAVMGDALLGVVGLFGAKRTRDTWRSTTPDVLASALIRIAEAPEHDRIVAGADLR